jgi:hypothetical protein
MGFFDNVAGFIRNAASKVGNVVGKVRDFVSGAAHLAGKVREVPIVGGLVNEAWNKIPGSGYIENAIGLLDKHGDTVSNTLSNLSELGKRKDPA